VCPRLLECASVGMRTGPAGLGPAAGWRHQSACTASAQQSAATGGAPQGRHAARGGRPGAEPGRGAGGGADLVEAGARAPRPRCAGGTSGSVGGGQSAQGAPVSSFGCRSCQGATARFMACLGCPERCTRAAPGLGCQVPSSPSCASARLLRGPCRRPGPPSCAAARQCCEELSTEQAGAGLSTLLVSSAGASRHQHGLAAGRPAVGAGRPGLHIPVRGAGAADDARHPARHQRRAHGARAARARLRRHGGRPAAGAAREQRPRRTRQESGMQHMRGCRSAPPLRSLGVHAERRCVSSGCLRRVAAMCLHTRGETTVDCAGMCYAGSRFDW